MVNPNPSGPPPRLPMPGHELKQAQAPVPVVPPAPYVPAGQFPPKPPAATGAQNGFGGQPGAATPSRQLPTNRGLLVFILLSVVTLGIYFLVVMTKIGGEVNAVATKRDGRNTMNFLLIALLLGPITGGIVTLIWFHLLSERIGAEMNLRGLSRRFGAADFWLWDFLGSLIIVGPFIYYYKLLHAMNDLNSDYNRRG